jgi:hypothetical protein
MGTRAIVTQAGIEVEMSKRGAWRHKQDRLEREGEKKLATMEVKALDAMSEIVERQTKPGESKQPRFTEPTSIFTSVYRWALSAMASEPGPRATMRQWDTWYRESVKREPFLSGLFNSVVQIDVNRGWTLEGGRNQVARYTKVLKDFDRYIKVGKNYLPGNGGGWRAYSAWQAQSYYATRMGFVSEVGRQGNMGPLFTMWSVDPCRCELTGNPALPLKYYPITSGAQDWDYQAYIRKCSLISTDEAALGYGFPAVARCYELAKIMVGVLSHYQQKVGTKTPDAILTGKYISQSQWEEAIRARNENLLADHDAYLNSIATIMSSGGDMPEFVLTTLSSLPDRWDIDLWTRILMQGYESAFGYKGEFTYQNAGVLGRGNEVETMHRNATAMGGKDFILAHQGELQNCLPPTVEFLYDERDVEGDKDEVALQLAKAQVITELSNWVEKSGGTETSRLTTQQIMQLAVENDVVPDSWSPGEEDVTATDEESPEDQDEVLPERVYRACQCFPNEPIVRYSWPSGKVKTLYRYGADAFVKRFTFYTPIVHQAALPAPIERQIMPNFTLNMAAQPAPVVNIPATTVNVDGPTVNAIMPEQQRQEPPIVNLTVEKQSPDVHVDAPVITVDGPVINMPEPQRQEPPIVNVSMPPLPAPVVNMSQPVVNVAPAVVNVPAQPVTLTVSNKTSVVKRDSKGRIEEVDNTPDVQIS